MKNEKVRSLRRQRKKNASISKDQSLQKVQENQGNSHSANDSATSNKQQNTKDRTNTLQQEKSNLNDAGDPRIIQVYKKIKCIFCGYEMASLAERPTCSKCGRRRFDRLTKFSVTKPNKLKGGVNMAKETEVKKPEEEKKPIEAEEQDEIDAMFD